MSREEASTSHPKPLETEEQKGLIHGPQPLAGEVTAGSSLDEDGRECQTPSSSDHRIPTSWGCPAAPHKTVQRKRKRSGSVPLFFETTRGDEVELFFQSNLELSRVIRARDRKRRCASI